MIRALPLLLLLSGCAHPLATCANAHRAIAIAEAAAARYCPMDLR